MDTGIWKDRLGKYGPLGLLLILLATGVLNPFYSVKGTADGSIIVRFGCKGWFVVVSWLCFAISTQMLMSLGETSRKSSRGKAVWEGVLAVFLATLPFLFAPSTVVLTEQGWTQKFVAWPDREYAWPRLRGPERDQYGELLRFEWMRGSSRSSPGLSEETVVLFGQKENETSEVRLTTHGTRKYYIWVGKIMFMQRFSCGDLRKVYALAYSLRAPCSGD